jgi:hypothetical protein
MIKTHPMKYLNFHIIIVVLFSLISCSENEIALNKEFQISEGENILIDNKEEELNLNFEKVIEYSLCPENVECVWAGRVRIQIIFNNNTFIIGILDDENPSKITFEDYEITLLNVTPKNEGENLTYIANFIVKEIQS